MTEITPIPQRGRGQRYTDQEIKLGLAALLYAGTIKKASDQTGVHAATLTYWRDHRPDLWSEVQADIAPKLDQMVLDQARELAVTWAEIEAQAAQRMADALPKLDVRDIPGAARNISTARAISVDKLQVLAGRPSSIVEHRSTAELVSQLGGVVDGQAEELE